MKPIMKKRDATSAIFLLDQKIKAEEFLERVASIALFFDSLSEEQLKQIKHWIKNTTEDEVKNQAITLLNAKKEEVVRLVANNAFIIQELKDEERKKAKIEVAKNLLDILDDETISIKTGLSIGEVKKLRENEM